MSYSPTKARVFDPRDYGNVDLSGAASSRAAIQAAVDAAAAAGGGVVELPAGTLLLSNTLNVTASNITVRGKGRATLVKIAAAVSTLHIIRVQGTEATPIRGVTISDLRWQGYGDDAGVTATSHGLYVRWCDWLKVENVWAHDCTFAAVRIDDSEHAIVNGVTVEQGTLGLNGGWYGIELGNHTKGAGARGYSGYHVVSNVTTHVPEHSIAVYLCDDVTITQVTATGNQNDWAFNWTGAQRVTMTNFVAHTSGGGYLYCEWDQTLGTSRGCAQIKFAHGQCTGLDHAPDSFSGGSPTPAPGDLNAVFLTSSPDVVIEDVYFDCSAQTLVTVAMPAIQADSASGRLRVFDCTINSPLSDGIKTATDGNTFSRVRVLSPRGAGSTNAGFNLSAGSFNIVQNCRVESGSQHGIYVNSTYTIIANNIVTGCAGDGVRVVAADVAVHGNEASTCTGWGFNVLSTGSRCRLSGNFAQTNTAGNYTSATGTALIVDRNNKGLTDLVAKTGNFTVGQLDFAFVVDASGGARTATLPAANGTINGRRFFIKNKVGSANSVTVAAAGSDTIDGAATITLTAGQTAQLVCDGTSLWNQF